MGEALTRLAEEDPTFRTRYDQETGQTIISGMGELHLEVIVDRMLREFRVERQRRPARGRLQGDDHARRPRPRAASSARPAATASTASSGWRSSRCERGAGFEFVNKIVGGAIPREFIRPVEAGREGGAGERRRWPATRSSTSR